jgi:L-ascorbate metabolism protein UlaG (beta-lactamase superfamily)
MRKLYLFAFGVILLVLITTIYSCLSAGNNFTEDLWQKSVEKTKSADLYAENFKAGEFFNPWMKMKNKGFFELLSWKTSFAQDYTDEEKLFRPKVLGGVKERIQKTRGDFVLWIGHNSFLLRIDNRYWLTDPVFSKRALIPARKTPPALSVNDLNEIATDLTIIITHNHYDHLDEDSIRSLPKNARVFVPKGLGEVVKKMNKVNVYEMNWWGEINISGSEKLICLPAQHWSLRIGVDRNSTLWASYLLKTNNYNIYFAGDSGYYKGFREIGRKYPGIDYAFMPITAYHPRWFMHYQHMNIPENLKAFKELGAKYFIPSQWGTFHLGDEPVGFPALELKREIKKRNLDKSRFKILNLGEIMPLKPIGN